MNNVQLLSLAQATAAAAITETQSAFAVVKSSVAAFAGAGNPDADWPAFTQNFQRELQSYRQAAQKDVPAPTATGRVAGAAPKATIPPDLFAQLPKDVQARLIAANPALAPAPTAAAPVPSAPTIV
jgi:hypothetical protein